jgi:hypothetical protein
MIRKNLVKVIASTLMLASIFALNPIGASASWKQDTRGWWYAQDNSWITGWKPIEGKWYYFNSDGYMAHDTEINGFKLGSDGAWINTPIAASSEKIVDVTVGTAEEFVNALGSNKRIILKPGVYNLSTINQVNNSDNSVTWETVQDGKELNLQNIHNLTIEGMDSGKVEIKVAPRFANIINFFNVQNITIKNIVAGHTPAQYECNEGVLKFTYSSDISIMNSELYGCGSIGLNINDVKRLNASNCTIDHCSLRAIQLYNSETIKFTETNIINHEAYSNIIMVFNSKDVTFEKCVMSDNHNFGWSFIDALNKSNILLDKCVIKNNSQSTDTNVLNDKVYFFNTTDYFGNNDSKITVKDSEISNNKCDYLLINKENVEFNNCTITNNTWK